jgi:SAM-dependent methyltransferase
MTAAGHATAGDQGYLFDGYASSYEDTVNDSIGASGETVDYFATLKARLLANFVRRDAAPRVLDFGCGTGLSTRALAREFDDRAELVGVDLSGASIEVARRNAPRNVIHEQLTTNSIPLVTGAVDVAVASCVFHHIERHEHKKWLAELVRVLRPGGRAFIFEHNPYNPLTRRAVQLCPFDKGVTLLQPPYTRRVMGEARLDADTPYFYFFLPRCLARFRYLEPWLRRLPLGAQYFVTGVKRAEVI